MKKPFIISGICFLFFMSPVVHAQMGYVSIPAAAFKGETEVEDYEVGVWWEPSELKWHHLLFKTSSSGRMVAPVYFPIDGVRVKNMRVTIEDDSNLGEIEAILRRVDLSTGHSEVVFEVSSGFTETPGFVKMWDGSASQYKFRQVENSKYAWYLTVAFWGGVNGLNLIGIRIEYE